MHAQRQLCPTPQAAQVALHNTMCMSCMMNNKLKTCFANLCMCRHALGRLLHAMLWEMFKRQASWVKQGMNAAAAETFGCVWTV